MARTRGHVEIRNVKIIMHNYHAESIATDLKQRAGSMCWMHLQDISCKHEYSGSSNQDGGLRVPTLEL